MAMITAFIASSPDTCRQMDGNAFRLIPSSSIKARLSPACGVESDETGRD